MKNALVATVTLTLAIATAGHPQNRRAASPVGAAATQVGGRHDVREGYLSGKWIEIEYGRPIKRGRDLFGPADFAEALNDGAEVWRAGANYSTRLITEVPLPGVKYFCAPATIRIVHCLTNGVTEICESSSWPHDCGKRAAFSKRGGRARVCAQPSMPRQAGGRG